MRKVFLLILFILLLNAIAFADTLITTTGGQIPVDAYLLFRGKQSIKVTYKDADEVSLSVGYIHLKSDGTEGLYAITTGFDFDVGSPTASTWGYIMCAVPSSGSTITVSDISYSETEPSLDEDKKGYYSADGTKRCIGFVLTDGSSNILQYIVSDNKYRWYAGITLVASSSASTWTSFSCKMPFDGGVALLNFSSAYSNNGNTVEYSIDGSTVHTQPAKAAASSRNTISYMDAPLVAKSGYFKWQSSTTSGGPYTDIPGATGTTYDPPPGLITTIYYVREATSIGGVCLPELSNEIEVTVEPALDLGVIAGAQTIC